MKLYHKINAIALIALSICVQCSCKKYLDEKPSKNFATISSLKDAQAILDYYITLNQNDLNSAEVSTDDYYLTQDGLDQLSEPTKRMYAWEKDFLYEPEINDWSSLYNAVYLANSALEVLPKIERNNINAKEWDNVKGQSLFFRSWFFLQGVNIWSASYSPEKSKSDLSIPLRLSTNFNEKSVRSTVYEVYQRMIMDMEEAANLLPVVQNGLTRPSKAAAFGLLSRIYLYKGDFVKSEYYASECLKIQGSLIDYSTLDAAQLYPIRPLNKEIIYQSYIYLSPALYNAYACIDQKLIGAYAENDLRRSIFFKENNDSTFYFFGSYQGSPLLFTGISVNEILITLAECSVRNGKIDRGLQYLDQLLVNRWKKDPATGKSLYVPSEITDKQQALDLILTERHKELLMRGLRWADIKRLNAQGYNIDLKRSDGKQVKVLPANSNLFVLPIPNDVISSSGMQQNER